MTHQDSSVPEEKVSDARRRKVLAAAVVGTSIEWYDFMIYGTAAAMVFSSQFFPSVNHTAGMLASFATFAVGFVARPLGGALFGHFGDRLGRKPALIIALMLMAVSSMLIGLLPTYGMIGVAAPILLAVLRFAQGIAVGGQWGGATLLAVEYAPPNRRGLYGGIPQIGTGIGLIVGTLVFTVADRALDDGQFASWGWRVGFLLSVGMLPVAYCINRFVEDTPEFRRAERRLEQKRHGAPRSSVLAALRHPRPILLIVAIYLVPGISFYVLANGMLAYGTHDLGIDGTAMLTAIMISMVAFIVGTLVFAGLSDIVGRRPLYAIGAVAIGAWSFAVFPLMQTRSVPLIILALVVGQLALTITFGPAPTMFAEMFPPEVRYAGASLGYQFANTLGSGFAPMIMIALLQATGTTVSVSLYVCAAATVALIALPMVGRLAIPRVEGSVANPETEGAATESKWSEQSDSAVEERGDVELTR